MNIIFGREQAESLKENYTVLELDTIRISPQGPELTAFCVVETVPILKMEQLEPMKKLHQDLLTEYRKQNWSFCEQALEHLSGFWGAEVDTFYAEINNRIAEYKQNNPGKDWTGVVQAQAE